MASKESNGGNVLFVSSNVDNVDWILGLACTFHMTPNTLVGHVQKILTMEKL